MFLCFSCFRWVLFGCWTGSNRSTNYPLVKLNPANQVSCIIIRQTKKHMPFHYTSLWIGTLTMSYNNPCNQGYYNDPTTFFSLLTCLSNHLLSVRVHDMTNMLLYLRRKTLNKIDFICPCRYLYVVYYIGCHGMIGHDSSIIQKMLADDPNLWPSVVYLLWGWTKT